MRSSADESIATESAKERMFAERKVGSITSCMRSRSGSVSPQRA